MRFSRVVELAQLRPNQHCCFVVGVFGTLCATVALVGLYPTAADRNPISQEDVSNAGAHAWRVPVPAHWQGQDSTETEQNGYGAPLVAWVAADYRRSALIASALGGEVETIFVEEGDRVKRGDALFRISSFELTLLQAQISRAEIEVVNRRREHTRLRDLAKTTPLSTTQVLAASAALREAERALSAAKATRSALNVDPDTSNGAALIVRAPLSGTVIQSSLRLGQSVPAKQTVLHIADTSKGLFVEVDVPESDVHELEIGTMARIDVQTKEHVAPIFAQIGAISDIVDPRRKTVRVRVPVEDSRLQINQALPIRFPARQVSAVGPF